MSATSIPGGLKYLGALVLTTSATVALPIAQETSRTEETTLLSSSSTVVDPQQLQTASGDPPRLLEIHGERFVVDSDPDLGLVLEHPKWSLLGYGETLADARQMLVERANVLAKSFGGHSPDKFDHEGGRLRDFVIRLQT